MKAIKTLKQAFLTWIYFMIACNVVLFVFFVFRIQDASLTTPFYLIPAAGLIFLCTSFYSAVSIPFLIVFFYLESFLKSNLSKVLLSTVIGATIFTSISAQAWQFQNINIPSILRVFDSVAICLSLIFFVCFFSSLYLVTVYYKNTL